jgi:RNA polymerase sporulation-specific sigma factor
METAKRLELFSNDELVRKVRGGDDYATAILVSRFFPFAKSRASFYCPDPSEREDFVQEGMLGLLSAIENFSFVKGASFKTFAFVCIERRMLSMLRAQSRTKRVPKTEIVQLSDELHNELTYKGPSPLDEIISEEDGENFERLVKERLTELEYSVLTLKLQGLDYNQTAQSLHISLKTVDNALQRAKKKLSGLGVLKSRFA